MPFPNAIPKTAQDKPKSPGRCRSTASRHFRSVVKTGYFYCAILTTQPEEVGAADRWKCPSWVIRVGWCRTDDFRSTPINRHRYRASGCLKRAKNRTRCPRRCKERKQGTHGPGNEQRWNGELDWSAIRQQFVNRYRLSYYWYCLQSTWEVGFIRNRRKETARRSGPFQCSLAKCATV